MTKPGPKSQLERELSTVVIFDRPPPPASLTPEERQVWLDATGANPPDWFRADALPMLRSYCRAVCMSEELAPQVKTAFETMVISGQDKEAVIRLEKISALADKWERLASHLATRLRITLQATRTADMRKPPQLDAEASPWDDE